MNLFNIQRAFESKAKRGWNTLYVCVDLHGTLIRPYHDKIEFYDYAPDVINWFNNRPDFKVILWTSSHQKEIDEFLTLAKEFCLRFDFVNGNPMEGNSPRANFDQKFYFNILLDDKAGFDPETDWEKIINELKRIGEWDRDTSAICPKGGEHKWGTDGQHSNEYCKKCFCDKPRGA